MITTLPLIHEYDFSINITTTPNFLLWVERI